MMNRDDSPRHQIQIQWDILGFIGLIVAAVIAAGVAIWQTKVERSDDRPPAEVTVLVVVTATPSRPAEKPAPTQSTTLPTNTPILLATHTPTAMPAPSIPTEVDCEFDFSRLALFVERTGGGNTVSYNLFEPVFPSGYIVGHGVEAYVNGQALRRMGDGGVTFIIQIDDRAARGTLTIKDGIFFIVSPEMAEKFLQLRVQYLADCYNKHREPVRYP